MITLTYNNYLELFTTQNIQQSPFKFPEYNVTITTESCLLPEKKNVSHRNVKN